MLKASAANEKRANVLIAVVAGRLSDHTRVAKSKA
jgi:hypothetical protein